MVNFLDSYDESKENDEIASKKEIIYVLAVAYHNLGVELEYLQRVKNNIYFLILASMTKH